MRTIREVLQQASKLLQGVVERPLYEARLLLSHAVRTPREHVIAYPEKPLSSAQVASYFELIARRQKYEPYAKIIGEKDFWSLPFYTTHHTLDPRPETELMVEAVLKYFPDRSAHLTLLDVGTGTGCILLSLLSEYPASYGVGVDCSLDALAAARRNGDRHHLSQRVKWICGVWAAPLSKTFDVILSNPPYIPTSDVGALSGEVLYDPIGALDGGEDGLMAYRQLATSLPSVTRSQTMLIVEVGVGQAPSVVALFIFSGFQLLEILYDLQGIERCLILQKK